MTISHSTAARNTMVDALTALLDVGGVGNIVLKTAADAVIVTLPLNATAFGAAAAGVATANAIATVAATATGIVTKFEAQNNAGTVVWQGTVGEDPLLFDLQMTNTDINSTDPISVSSWTYTGPT